MSINSSRLLTAPPVTRHPTQIHLKQAACDLFVVFVVPFSEHQPLLSLFAAVNGFVFSLY